MVEVRSVRVAEVGRARWVLEGFTSARVGEDWQQAVAPESFLGDSEGYTGESGLVGMRGVEWFRRRLFLAAGGVL